MSSTAINNALTAHIQAIGLTQPIAWPNAPFTTPNNQTWLRVTYLMGEKGQTTLRQTDEQVGIVQIDIFAPKQSGRSATAIADTLDAAFSRLTPIERNGVKIYVTSVAPAAPVEDDPWWLLRFRASIRAYVAKS